MNALKDALAATQKFRDEASADFDRVLKASMDDTHAALDGWKKNADDAADDAKRSAEAAARLVGDENTRLRNLNASGLKTIGGAAVPTPKPAGGSRLVQAASAPLHAQTDALLADTSLESMHRQVEKERQQAEGARSRAAAASLEAAAAAERSANASRAAFAAQFLVGIGQLVVLLQDGISNPVKAVAIVGPALGALTGLEKVLTADLGAALQREADTRAGLADAPHADADTAKAHADRARDVLAKLRRAVLLQTVVERQTLAKETLTSPTPAPVTRPRLALASAAALSTFSRSLPARAASLRAPLLRVKAAGPPDVTPFRAKVSADFAAQFKGKNAPAAAATRDALLAEARRRFASDPKTLAGVEKLITDASKVR